MKPKTPTSFPSNNTHRVILFQPDVSRSDFERLEELIADGYGAAREALGRMQSLPAELVVSLQPAEKALRDALDKRTLLAEECRGAILRWLADARKFGQAHTSVPNVDAIRDRLNEVIAVSDRVLDLLAAEREIACRRRNGR